MRLTLTAMFICAATSALSQDAPAADTSMPAGIAVNTSYNVSAPMTAQTPDEEAAEDLKYRTQMYAQSAKECADLLALIATSCSITNIAVSTQITRQPGLTTQMYASGNVTMMVEMK